MSPTDHTSRRATFHSLQEAGQLGEHQCLRRARASQPPHERVATTASIEGSTAATPSTRPQHQRSQNSHVVDRGPYQGAGWTDRLLNRGFAFVHIWSHFVQLAAFVAPPFYLLAKVLDLPIIPTGTAFGMGLNAGAACYCGAMEVLGATRDAGDDGIIVAPVTAVVFMSVATRFEWSLLYQFVGVCCVGPLASMCATLYVKLRRPKVS